VIYLLLLIILTACASRADSLVLPTLAVLDTVTPSQPVNSVAQVQPLSTLEQVASQEVVTLPADFIVITPTAPPSKTPTQTATPTATPSFTPQPTRPTTATATATAYIPPTKIMDFFVITAVAAKPIERVCDSAWFFLQPRPDPCPMTEATTSQAVFQRFENGLMIWIEQYDQIFVMYGNMSILPAWETFPDEFEEGMRETDDAFEPPPLDHLFQPRRGFGTLWRTHEQVRERIGWSIDRWEVAYSSTVQEADDGTVYLEDPQGDVVALLPQQQDWQRYFGSGEATRLELELLSTLTVEPPE
jgi:hypothetical protein